MHHSLPAPLRLLLAFCVLATIAASPAAAQYFSPPIRTNDRQISKQVCSWKDLRESFIVMQQTDYSCGAASLATVIRYYWGDDVNERMFLDTIREMLTQEELEERIKNGLAMTDLRRAAVKRGYPAVMGRRTFEELYEVRVPLILRIVSGKYEHFVVFRGIVGDRVYLADPIRGNIAYPIHRFQKEWTDGAVLVVAKRGVTGLPEYSPLMVHYSETVRPQLQAVRRGLTQPPPLPVPVILPIGP